MRRRVSLIIPGVPDTSADSNRGVTGNGPVLGHTSDTYPIPVLVLSQNSADVCQAPWSPTWAVGFREADFRVARIPIRERDVPRDRNTKTLGPNPFAVLGVTYSSDGRW